MDGLLSNLMIFRRILAGILVAIFVFVSLASFLVFAVTNTFLSPSFYENGVQEPAYEFLVDYTVTGLRDSDPFIAGHFTETDLHREITSVFSQDLFAKLSRQVSTEMQTWKEDPNQPLTVSLSLYRESLLTLTHNLSFQLFASLRECNEAEVPVEGDDGLPTCVPPGAEYNVVAAPFADEFEKAIYAAVPEQLQIDLNSSLGKDGMLMSQWFAMVDTVKLAFYGMLLVLIVFIALIIYRPFTTIMVYEGVGFLLSGIAGLVVVLGFSSAPSILAESVTSDNVRLSLQHFIGAVSTLFTAEIQKAAFVFLALGIALILVRVYLKFRSS